MQAFSQNPNQTEDYGKEIYQGWQDSILSRMSLVNPVDQQNPNANAPVDPGALQAQESFLSDAITQQMQGLQTAISSLASSQTAVQQGGASVTAPGGAAAPAPSGGGGGSSGGGGSTSPGQKAATQTPAPAQTNNGIPGVGQPGGPTGFDPYAGGVTSSGGAIGFNPSGQTIIPAAGGPGAGSPGGGGSGGGGGSSNPNTTGQSSQFYNSPLGSNPIPFGGG